MAAAERLGGFPPDRFIVRERHPHLGLWWSGVPAGMRNWSPRSPGRRGAAAREGSGWPARQSLPHTPPRWPLRLFGMESGLFPGEGPSQQRSGRVLASISTQPGSGRFWMSSMWGHLGCPEHNTHVHTRARTCLQQAHAHNVLNTHVLVTSWGMARKNVVHVGRVGCFLWLPDSRSSGPWPGCAPAVPQPPVPALWAGLRSCTQAAGTLGHRCRVLATTFSCHLSSPPAQPSLGTTSSRVAITVHTRTLRCRQTATLPLSSPTASAQLGPYARPHSCPPCPPVSSLPGGGLPSLGPPCV